MRSDWFPSLRKSPREIFRVIGGADAYPDLEELLRSLDWCLDRGWGSHKLRSRARQEFQSLVAEIRIAEHLFLRNFHIDPALALRVSKRKPDLAVVAQDVKAIVEVTRPREWEATERFRDEVLGLLKNADIPLDFACEVDVRLRNDFDERGQLLQAHPDVIETGVMRVREDCLRSLAVFLSSLGPVGETVFQHESPDVNLRMIVAFNRIGRSRHAQPDRLVSWNHGVTGYVPEHLFGKLVGRITAKARRRQAGSASHDLARVLACDLSSSQLLPHLNDGVRIGSFVETLARDLAPRIGEGYDLIALCVPTRWGSQMRTRFVVSGEGVPTEVTERLFGSLALLAQLSGKTTILEVKSSPQP